MIYIECIERVIIAFVTATVTKKYDKVEQKGRYDAEIRISDEFLFNVFVTSRVFSREDVCQNHADQNETKCRHAWDLLMSSVPPAHSDVKLRRMASYDL